jgi:hypothetical protein
VLDHPEVTEVITTQFTLSEVQEYAGQLAVKKRLSLDIVLMAVAALPVTDVEILALALHSHLAVWSNDSDFEGVGVERFTTAELLARLK